MNLLDFLFPKRCVNCGRVGKYICTDCRRLIVSIKPNEHICAMCGRLALDGITHPRCRTRYGIDRMTSFFHYGGVVQKAIKSIKYRLVSDLTNELTGMIVAPDVPDYSVIPVPLHPKKFRSRGFNQAEILASFLKLPVKTDILSRIKETRPQAEIKNRTERIENMKHSFVSKTARGNIILFDDVATTRATLQNAAYALKKAGASYIWAMTIAR